MDAAFRTWPRHSMRLPTGWNGAGAREADLSPLFPVSALSNTPRLLPKGVMDMLLMVMDEVDESEFAIVAGLCFHIGISDEAIFLYTP